MTTVEPVSCPALADGNLTITASIDSMINPPPVFEYSLDGLRFQASPSFTGLAAGHYMAYARVLGQNCIGQAAEAVRIEAPASPSIIAAIANSYYSGIIQWTLSAGAISYEVEYQIIGASAWQRQSAGPRSALLVSDLQNATTYAVRVRAICSGGISGAWSPERQFTTPENPEGNCKNPGGVIVSQLTEQTATIKWNAVGGAICSIVAYAPDVVDLRWTEHIVAGNQFQLTGLRPGQRYQVRVASQCFDCGSQLEGRSRFSQTQIFTTLSQNREALMPKIESTIYRVYPNPSNGVFNLSIEADQSIDSPLELSIFDLWGKQVYETTKKESNLLHQTHMLNLQHLAAGVYFLKIQQGENQQLIKISIHP